MEILLKNKELIFKPSIDSGGGKSIIFIESKQDKLSLTEINNAFKELKEDFVVQKVIEQHEELSAINSTSVNTIRVMSFLNNNNVHILSSILRMGINNSRTDNESSGGISCGIDRSGNLKNVAYDRFGNKFTKHPQGYIFKGNKIPNYDEIINIILKNHIKFGHFKLISWDFAIDSQGDPVLIEYNLGGQGINFHQMDNGPLFGRLTEEVLFKVFEKKIS